MLNSQFSILNIDQIVNAVLYEGYLLYPYRRSSIKNRRRWNFGLVYPEPTEPSSMTTECLVVTDSEGTEPKLSVEVRFLQITPADEFEDTSERRIEIKQCGVETFEFGGIKGNVEVQSSPLAAGLFRIRVRVSNRSES